MPEVANLLKEKVMWFTVWCLFWAFSDSSRWECLVKQSYSQPGIKAEMDEELEQT